MKPAIRTVLTALSIAVFGANANGADLAGIRAHLAEEGATAKTIEPSTVPGLLEVVLSDNTILYASEDGRYFIVGDMIDVVSKHAITRERIATLTAKDFPSLPHDLALHFGSRGSKTKLFVIADPNCPYCTRYYQKLEKMQDVEIDVLLVAILGAKSEKNAVSIYCAADPQTAYTDSVRGIEPPDNNCKAGQDRFAAVNAWLRSNPIKSTPTTIFSDGVTERGDLPPDMIAKHTQG